MFNMVYAVSLVNPINDVSGMNHILHLGLISEGCLIATVIIPISRRMNRIVKKKSWVGM